MGAVAPLLQTFAGAALAVCLALPVRAETLHPDAAAQYLMAVDAEHRSDWPQAAHLYTAVWERTGADQPLRKGFLFSLGSGDMPTALHLAKSISSAMPEYAVAHALEAADAIRKGDLASARSLVGDLPDQGISVPLGAMLKAWLTALPAAAASPRDPAATQALLEGDSDFPTLQTLHEALIADYTGDRTEADKAYADLAAAHDSPRLAVFARDYYLRTGQATLAKDTLAQLSQEPDGIVLASIEADKTVPPKPSLVFGSAEAVYDMAELLLDADHPDIALFYARIAAWLDPGAADMRFLLGEIEQAQQRYAEAAQDFSSAPAASAFADLGQLDAALNDERAGDSARAITILQAFIKRRPGEVEPKSILADMMSRRNRFADAIALYGECLAQMPEDDPRRGTMLLNRGIAYDHGGNPAAAEADLAAAVKATPDDPLALNYLGYFWVSRSEHLDEAHAVLEKAHALQPGDAAIADSLGWADYALGDYARAAATLEQAVLGAPADSLLNEHLGDAYWRIGRRTEARYQWQRALINAAAGDRGGLRGKLADGLPEQGVFHADAQTPNTAER